MDGMKVALGTRGMTVEGTRGMTVEAILHRQCTKDREDWIALVHM